jgi:CrcB protein
MVLAWIAVGGGAGAVLRYLVSGWAQRMTPGAFPLGTLTVNVVGCLVIGWLAGIFAGPAILRDGHRLGLLVGLLGGFTTFSSFGWETMKLLSEGRTGAALLNVGLANVLGLCAVWVGYRFSGA